MITECKECPKPIKVEGQCSTHAWLMQPGQAWKLDQPKGLEIVDVDQKFCKKAQYTFYLIFVGGRTAAEFTVGGVRYAQPLHRNRIERELAEGKASTPRAKKPSITTPKQIARAVVREERKAAKIQKRHRKPLDLL